MAQAGDPVVLEQKQGLFGTPQYTGMLVIGAVIVLVGLRRIVISI